MRLAQPQILINDHRLWTRDGAYVGKPVNGLFYDTSGANLGEFKNDRLAFNTLANKIAHQPST